MYNKIFLFLLLPFLLPKTVKGITETDSLIHITKNAKTDSLKIKAYNELTKKVFYYDTKQALIFADSALNLSKKANNTYLEGITRLNISSISYHTGKYKEGIEQA